MMFLLIWGIAWGCPGLSRTEQPAIVAEVFRGAADRAGRVGTALGPRVAGDSFEGVRRAYSRELGPTLEVAIRALTDFSGYGRWLARLSPHYVHLRDEGLINHSLLSLYGFSAAVRARLRRQGYPAITFMTEFPSREEFYQSIAANRPFFDVLRNTTILNPMGEETPRPGSGGAVTLANYSHHLRVDRGLTHGPISHALQRSYLHDVFVAQGLDPENFFSLVSRRPDLWESLLDRMPGDPSGGMANPGILWAVTNIALRWPFLMVRPDRGSLLVIEGSIFPQTFWPLGLNELTKMEDFSELERANYSAVPGLMDALRKNQELELRQLRGTLQTKGILELLSGERAFTRSIEYVRALIEVVRAYRLESEIGEREVRARVWSALRGKGLAPIVGGEPRQLVLSHLKTLLRMVERDLDSPAREEALQAISQLN